MQPPDAQPKPTLNRTYRYRIYPTRQQEGALEQQIAFCCDLYNAALQERRDAWRLQRKSLSLYDQQHELTEVRAAGLAPENMSLRPQRYALRRLDLAFQAFFRRVKAGQKPGFPRFRSKRRYDSLTWDYGNGSQIHSDGRLALLGVGHVKVKWHRAIPDGADLRTVTVRRSCGRWYVSFALEIPARIGRSGVNGRPEPPLPEKPDAVADHALADHAVAMVGSVGHDAAPVPAGMRAVGIDLGIASFARLSTGDAIPGPAAGKAACRRVRRLQRQVARRKRRSNRRRKAVAMLARAREHEANVRRDHRHKVARDLVQRFDVIYVEGLRIRSMTRSAKGTVEAPGSRVKQKAGLNRSILDQGWGDFLACLESKAEEAGARVVKIPAAYTSQTCAECGVVDARSRPSQAVFACVACGHRDHADANAAKVIQGLGRSLQVPTVGRSRAVA